MVPMNCTMSQRRCCPKTRCRNRRDVSPREAKGIDSAAARQDWLAAIENLVPATLAAERADAAGRARTDNTEHRIIAQRRHPQVQNLLLPDDGANSSGN